MMPAGSSQPSGGYVGKPHGFGPRAVNQVQAEQIGSDDHRRDRVLRQRATVGVTTASSSSVSNTISNPASIRLTGDAAAYLGLALR